MLDNVLAYVKGVLAGERKGDPAVGRYLMDALGAGIGTGDLEKGGFNASLQVGDRTTCLSGDLILSLRSGHTNGVVPRQPRTVPSGGVIPPSADHIVMSDHARHSIQR